MRVVLVSLDYPPESTEGVARHRQVLAEALTALGHTVHVVTRGKTRSSTVDDGVTVHRVPVPSRPNTFLPGLPVLDRPLTDAQLLAEATLDLARRLAIDVIDVPLWLAQPMALVGRAPCPVVVWLQTSLLQIVELQDRAPRPHEVVLADIDRTALTGADACIADSASILAEVERLYGVPGLSDRTTVVHPGLPDQVVTAPARERDLAAEILVVGRLEQRKGTRHLFEALPRLLARVPQALVRFVGRDNSGADGFRREHGVGYPEYFARTWPDLASRVVFEGYVDDATLAGRYRRADVLLHPALYESFGLIFVEAMRAGRPTVAFRQGGAREVFAGNDRSDDGLRSGAVLCEPGDFDGLVDAAATLVEHPERRLALGRAGRHAFEKRFTATRMARETAMAYARVIAPEGSRRQVPGRPRVFQVMEALQDRDAVSGIARANAAPLAALGAERQILSIFAAESVWHETGRLRGVRFEPTDALLVHYWGFSRLERLIRTFPGRTAVHFHHITPPTFFSPRTPHFEMTRRGYAQLSRLADAFDLVVADSRFNLAEFARHLTQPRPTLCLYPAIDVAALRSAPWDRAFSDRVRRESEGPVWLFVGRVAPNKRQDRLMRAFSAYAARGGKGRLFLVGDTTAVPDYVARLERLRRELPHGDRVVLTGSVSGAELHGFYRSADLFVCASEHEGFCMPLAEAMAFYVPTMALDRGAVAETLGGSGLLFSDWDADVVAAEAARLLAAPDRQTAMALRQQQRLQAFSPESVQRGLAAVVAFLRDGADSRLFRRSDALEPAAAALEVPVGVTRSA